MSVLAFSGASAAESGGEAFPRNASASVDDASSVDTIAIADTALAQAKAAQAQLAIVCGVGACEYL